MVTFLVESYDESKPFGAKSIAEIERNDALPALVNAIYDAVGAKLQCAPFTAEKIFMRSKSLKNRNYIRK